MAKLIPWHGINKILNPPKDWDNSVIQDMPVFNNGKYTVTCWQLSPEELAKVAQNSGKVFVAVMYGASQPPMFVGTEQTVKDVCVDFGKTWMREQPVPDETLPNKPAYRLKLADTTWTDWRDITVPVTEDHVISWQVSEQVDLQTMVEFSKQFGVK